MYGKPNISIREMSDKEIYGRCYDKPAS
jgi:hypothetical protein